MAFKRSLALALVLLLATTGVVFAAFVPSLQAQGTWNEDELRTFIQELKGLRDIDQSQVRVIEVTMDSGGTGWHSHPGAPSLLLVEQGTIEYRRPDRSGNCVSTTLGPGAAISHPMSTHDLRPVGDSAVFTVVYFSGVGATLTVPESSPCG